MSWLESVADGLAQPFWILNDEYRVLGLRGARSTFEGRSDPPRWVQRAHCASACLLDKVVCNSPCLSWCIGEGGLLLRSRCHITTCGTTCLRRVRYRPRCLGLLRQPRASAWRRLVSAREHVLGAKPSLLSVERNSG